MTAEWRDAYRQALSAYLTAGGEEPLVRSYEIGREVMAGGSGPIPLLEAHHEAVLALLRADPGGDHEILFSSANLFLLQGLSAFEMLHRGHQEANAVLRRLNGILEVEAKRIAHVLHDEAAQMLATIYLELAELRREAPQSVEPRVERIRAHLDQVHEQLRRLSHELRPPMLDPMGLMPALRFLAQGVGERSGLHIEVSGTVRRRFPTAVETTVYRVVQEALNNAVRHACAQEVGVRLWIRNRTLHCVVEDDGVGFDYDACEQGLGLLGIQERVRAVDGSLKLQSRRGKGTRVRVTIPLSDDESHQRFSDMGLA